MPPHNSEHAHSEDKRRKILRAAVRVFASKGYEATRVADIAREANVAYGLVYHYFDSKEDVLNSIFQEHLGLVHRVIETIDREKGSAREKLEAVVAFMIDGCQVTPDVVRVLLLELRRSAMLLAAPRAEAVEGLFQRIEALIRRHQKDGSLRPGIDPRMASYVFVGALETLLSGFALGTLPLTEQAVEQAKAAVVEIAWKGLGADQTSRKAETLTVETSSAQATRGR
jgi:TetR/AcrR family fatty acid metabolism transcriptional regulator